jgi:hypothetical protein
LMARTGFIALSIVSSACIAMLAYRSGRIEHAHFSLDLNSKVQAIEGQPLAMQVFFKNVGTGPSINTDTYSRLIPEEDESKHSSDDAIGRFKEYEKIRDIGTNNIPKDEPGHFMVARGPILGHDDVTNLVSGVRTVYLVGTINFKDDFGSHTQFICKVLEKPVRPDMANWGTCGKWDDEKDKWWWQ